MDRKILRATLRWHLKKAQRARKDNNFSARRRHLASVDRLSAQLKEIAQ